MMMQMLSAGGMSVLSDNVRQADEDNTQGYYEFEPVKRTKHDASWLAAAEGSVVKMVYLLLKDLPPSCQYRVVFMQRKLSEVLASQEIMLQRRGESGTGMPADRLAELFKQQLDNTKAWLADQVNFRVLYVDYQNVVDDPQTQSRRIGEFLDGHLDTMAMAAVVDPELYRQRDA